MKLSETIRGLPVAIEVSDHQRRFIRTLADEVAQLEEENEELKTAVQAAIDYFTDGIDNEEQYDAYLRFVDAAQPFFVVAGEIG